MGVAKGGGGCVCVCVCVRGAIPPPVRVLSVKLRCCSENEKRGGGK